MNRKSTAVEATTSKARGRGMFAGMRLAARAAYSTLFGADGKVRTVNLPRSFFIEWCGGADFLIAVHHWENVHHKDPEDGWGLSYSEREIAGELGLSKSSIHEALYRMERSGMVLRTGGCRFLYLHPYTVRLYLTWNRGGEKLTLPDHDRTILAGALEREGSLELPSRRRRIIPANYALESRFEGEIEELRRACLNDAALNFGVDNYVDNPVDNRVDNFGARPVNRAGSPGTTGKSARYNGQEIAAALSRNPHHDKAQGVFLKKGGNDECI